MRRNFLTCLAAALTLATAACGGGSDAPSVVPAVAPLAPLNGPPVIVAMPMSLSVSEGSSGRLTVVAGGEPPLQYQWRRNGVPIEGATTSDYVTSPLMVTDNDVAFDVVVSNDLGSVPSDVARVYVRPLQDSVGRVAKLRRLANIVVALVDGARVTQNLFLDSGPTARVPPTHPCSVSGSFWASIEGDVVPLGASLPLPGAALDVTYAACRFARGLFHDGRVTLHYEFPAGSTDQLRYVAVLQDLTVMIGVASDNDEFSFWNVTLNGQVDAQGEIGNASANDPSSRDAKFVFTPDPGTTVVSRQTGRTATYLAGSYVAQGSSSYPYPASVEFRNLTFAIDGSTYVVSNSGPFTPAVVTRNGQPIGKLELAPYYSTDENAPGESSQTVDGF